MLLTVGFTTGGSSNKTRSSTMIACIALAFQVVRHPPVYKGTIDSKCRQCVRRTLTSFIELPFKVWPLVAM
jgi:hypothetical protein